MITAELSKIEKQILIRAPRERVWQAITTLDEFWKWFSVEASGKFEPGARIRMISTHEGCAGVVIDVEVKQMENGRRFSWLWHPGEVRPEVDYSQEPKTTV